MLHFQLAQFADRDDVRSLVVYVAQSGSDAVPALVPIGHWPQPQAALEPGDGSDALRQPSHDRRWLPLRRDRMLLGALQVQTDTLPWSESLSQRLQAVALCLTEALCQDLEHQRLEQQLQHRNEQLEVLVHQLRNPLTALRTFGQLLRRRLEDDQQNRPLVEGLLAEERQLNRYVDALARLGTAAEPALTQAGSEPLLLPPVLSSPAGEPLAALLEPLLSRAAATAALQHRPWHGPGPLPDWRGDSGAVAEIVANLLENAFRYSGDGVAIGLQLTPGPLGGPCLCVWDGGAAIAAAEREAIFERGVRGERGTPVPGTGLGLALARDLARGMGAELGLVVPPAAASAALPADGNAFCLSLPPSLPAR
ncbi:MAG: HAMP domain-containing histidine kinase [Cyanobacteria bacterium K_DeepCast_35m_m2_023]|nr:HAMP domain-containing histidine kinase [Cyanobacteria bacterium K_DeepCast_35m_m2_023]